MIRLGQQSQMKVAQPVKAALLTPVFIEPEPISFALCSCVIVRCRCHSRPGRRAGGGRG